jgi:hypothetical protein
MADSLGPVPAEVGEALRRILAGPPLEEVGTRITAQLAEARRIGGSAGLLATALMEVVQTTHGWLAGALGDPDATMPVHEAVAQITAALERGLIGEAR